jgi:hypothetical protein
VRSTARGGNDVRTALVEDLGESTAEPTRSARHHRDPIFDRKQIVHGFCLSRRPFPLEQTGLS